jgi:hypothetical protein
VNLTIQILAYAFYVIAFLLAVPGIAYVAFDWSRRLRRRFFPPPPVTTFTAPNRDPLLLLFEGFTKGVAAAGKAGGFLSELVAGILAGIAISAVLVGTLLFFTARGLLAQEPWARWVAGLMMVNVLLISLLSVLTSRTKRPKRFVISLLLAAASGVALNALWQGYTDSSS